MALRGTLKDFGIADILQLIGHQGKSGVLTVRNGDHQVDIYFHDGAVVRAESSTRQKKELLGAMLLRAEVLREEELDRALEAQKRTLKRLGDILVEHGSVERHQLSTFTRLQTTETIYRLFVWRSGTYEFTQKDVPLDPAVEPIRGESILMEGFRQLDEWPAIRRKVSSYSLVFAKLKELPAAAATDDLNLDDAFGDLDGGGGGGSSDAAIGDRERAVYQLIADERDVQKLIDLSRLGEFDTCKALVRLIEGGYIHALRQESAREPSAEATVGGISARPGGRVLPVFGRVAVVATLLAAALLLVGSLDRLWLTSLVVGDAWGYADTSLQAQLATTHMGQLRRALAVFEAIHGAYPASLQELVDAGLVAPRDLRFPWQQAYVYERQGAGYALYRPLY